MERMNLPRRLAGMDFIRLAGTLGVFLYHFGCATGNALLRKRLVSCANGQWSGPLVGLFFMLSGALLYHRYAGEKLDVPAFYRRRFRAIYPEFWLAFLVCYARRVLAEGSLFYRGRPWLLLLSLLGLDGYFLYLGPNYYILGQWFLGAIILLYLLFPLLLRAFQRAPAVFWALLCIAGLAVERTGFFRIASSRNLICCAFQFVTGMMLMRYRSKLSGKACLPLCAAIEILLLCVPLGMSPLLCSTLHACALYVLLGRLGALLEARCPRLSRGVSWAARLSYCAYLTHSVALSVTLNRWNPAGLPGALAALLLCALMTWLGAAALRGVTRRLLRRLDSHLS